MMLLPSRSSSAAAAAAAVAVVVLLFPAIKYSSFYPVDADAPDDDGAAIFIRVCVPNTNAVAEPSVPYSGRGGVSSFLSSYCYY